MTAVSQRPRLTFAVGITGHRPNKLPPRAQARAEIQLAAVFAVIDAACAARRKEDANCYQEAPHRVRLFSNFAEGVDRLAVKLRPPHWEVTAVLPFRRERYEEDFVTRDERGAIASDHRPEFAQALREAVEIVELVEGTDGAPAAYARAGAYSLRQIDILVAVWDGAEAAGIGGTAHVVAQALEGGIPVVWIASTREQAPWLIEHMADVAREAPLADATSGPIAKAVHAALAIDPPSSRRLGYFLAAQTGWGEDRSAHPDAVSRFVHVWTLGGNRPPRSLSEIGKEWGSLLAQLPESGELKGRLEHLVLPRFAAAEALADQYTRFYRGAHILFYLFALMAILIALVAMSPIVIGRPEGETSLIVKGALALLEWLLLGAIVAMVRKDERRRFRESAFDCRALAEALRHLRFLAPIGECTVHCRRRGRTSKVVADWVLWYLRATIRELGSPSALLDGPYQHKLLVATERTEVDGEIARHRDNSSRLGRLHLTLLHVGEACFLSAIALLTIFLLLFISWLGLRFTISLGSGIALAKLAIWEGRLWQFLAATGPFVTLLAALLPAAGAILAGIRVAAGFERIAERSRQAVGSLRGLKTDFAIARQCLELDKTAVTLLETADLQAGSIGAGPLLYGRERLTLPV